MSRSIPPTTPASSEKSKCDRPAPPSRIIRKRELLALVGLSDPTIWRMERDGKFPKRLRLGGNSCGWLESEVYQWISNLAEARN